MFYQPKKSPFGIKYSWKFDMKATIVYKCVKKTFSPDFLPCPLCTLLILFWMAERFRTWAIPWLISHNWTIGPYYSHYIWARWAIVACLIQLNAKPSLQLELPLNSKTFQERQNSMSAFVSLFLTFIFLSLLSLGLHGLTIHQSNMWNPHQSRWTPHLRAVRSRTTGKLLVSNQCLSSGVALSKILNWSLCVWHIFSQDINWANSVLRWIPRHH